MRKCRLYTAGVYVAMIPGIGGCVSNVNASSGTTAATQESQEASKEGTTVEDTTVVESVMDAIENMEGSQAEALQSIHIYGLVTKMEGGRLSIDNQSGMDNSGEIIPNVPSSAMYILDAVTGLSIKAEDIKDGEAIYAYIDPAVTISLPLMTNTEVIFADIPADAKVSDFVEAKPMIADVITSGSVLAAVDGTEHTPAPDCDIFPYLTRNIVTLDNLTQGGKYVVRPDDDNAVVKIMVFTERIWIQQVRREEGAPTRSGNGDGVVEAAGLVALRL